MIYSIIRPIIRTKFILTSRRRATAQIQQQQEQYLALAHEIDSHTGSKQVMVPMMPGIDEDMRNWSFFMILEHNTIVNRLITNTTRSLAHGKEPIGFDDFDIKKDVMPSGEPDMDKVSEFTKSIDFHNQVMASLGRLRGTKTEKHPLFGKFNAHRWHCMFAFHLQIHYRQAKYVAKHVTAE